ncbi:MAG: ABC transporter permease subunit, partial [Plesiomonas sp.]
LGLIYLFGGQGIMTNYIEIHLYGPVGVILGGVIFTLPHAVLLLTTTLRCIDPRLYQAAEMLGATRGEQFISVTLPNTIYGIISTCFVVFTLTLTDFGIAKVLSGQYNLLATEIYQQIVGQNNFAMGSTLSLLLIMPVLMAFGIDSWARKKQARLTSADYPRHLHPVLWRDSLFTLLCWLPAGIIISVIMVVVWGSLITYWPYDFSITLDNYAFSQMGYNWQPYINSLRFAVTVAITGTFGCFITAYIVQRGNLPQWLQSSLRLLALLPLGIPGTVLGLAYLLTFNQPGSWLTLWSGSLSILVINTVIHLFSVAFISFSSTLTQMNRHYEKVGASLGIRSFTTFQRIILPLSQHTLADVFFYLFTNALTTVSAVIFLYGPDSLLASISILTMDDAGDFAAASAMGTVLLLTALTAKTIHFIYLKKFGFPSVRSSL